MARKFPGIMAIALCTLLQTVAIGPAGGTDIRCTVSGMAFSVYNQPISRLKLTVRVGVSPTVEVRTDDFGFWSFDDVPLGATVLVYPSESLCYPGSIEFKNVFEDVQGGDFLVYPRVSGWLNTYVGQGAEAEVIVEGIQVGVSTPGGYWEFYPDEFNLAHSGTIWFQKPFHTFSPQAQGTISSYDCRFSPRAPALPQQTLEFEPDQEATPTWVDPGGLGWYCFPQTPDHVLPNNPEFLARVDFQGMGGTWQGDRIRLWNPGQGVIPGGQVTSVVDLTDDNGHVGEFRFPVQGCGQGRVDLQVQVLKYGVPTWEDLPPYSWLTSTSDVDLNGDGIVSLSDVGLLSTHWGECIGDEGYEPCANFQPDSLGCISLSEVAIFHTAFNLSGGKAWDVDQFDVSVEGEICRPDEGEDCGAVVVSSSSGWDAVLVRFEAAGEPVWQPMAGFSGKSILLPDPGGVDAWCLYLIGPAPAGSIPAGRMIQGEKAEGGFLRLSGTGALAPGPHSPSGEADNPVITAVPADSYPNPFNSRTTIRFDIDAISWGRLSVFDLDGRRVALLYEGVFDEGEKRVIWDGSDDRGRPLPSGHYCFRLEMANGRGSTGKMTLLK
ncbi:hypothetical protein KJ682_11750 [bacterium]|nr:hypothetical protein [bacterium]